MNGARRVQAKLPPEEVAVERIDAESVVAVARRGARVSVAEEALGRVRARSGGSAARRADLRRGASSLWYQHGFRGVGEHPHTARCTARASTLSPSKPRSGCWVFHRAGDRASDDGDPDKDPL